MSHPPNPTLRDELDEEYRSLDNACRHYGFTATMFRTAKFVFYTVAILFAVYLIEFTELSTIVAVGVAVFAINGPEAVEMYLVRQDVIADPDTPDNA